MCHNYNLEIGRLFYCGTCQKYYWSPPNTANIACAVLHPPGSCCHLTDKKIKKDTLDKILDIINKEK